MSLITAGLTAYSFLVLLFAINIPAAKGISPVNMSSFFSVFEQNMWINVERTIEILVSHLIDVTGFWFFKNRTGNNKICFRATDFKRAALG